MKRSSAANIRTIKNQVARQVIQMVPSQVELDLGALPDTLCWGLCDPKTGQWVVSPPHTGYVSSTNSQVAWTNSDINQAFAYLQSIQPAPYEVQEQNALADLTTQYHKFDDERHQEYYGDHLDESIILRAAIPCLGLEEETLASFKRAAVVFYDDMIGS